MKRIALLGSTGSVGTSCLDVVAAHSDRLQVAALTAHRRWEPLAKQAERWRPRWVVVADPLVGRDVARGAFGKGTEVLVGPEGLEQVARAADVDVVVAAIVGAAGLRSTWAALEAGKTVALANKETLVVAGPLATATAARTGARLVPVDSEHSAVFQALQAGRPAEVRRIVLTASGGPFRGWTAERLADVTPQQALAHPTWTMGPKITIDSATLMNKALEVIEARWLFGVPAESIEVVVHPQSVVHSLVEFSDGSVVAQLSPPDMKLPIQYALSYPDRWEGIGPRMDWRRSFALDFSPPDCDAFPALRLGFEVAQAGGTAGAVLNAANEVAVERFLQGTLRFPDIPRLAGEVLAAHEFDADPSLDDLLGRDAWAREEARRWRS